MLQSSPQVQQHPFEKVKKNFPMLKILRIFLYLYFIIITLMFITQPDKARLTKSYFKDGIEQPTDILLYIMYFTTPIIYTIAFFLRKTRRKIKIAYTIISLFLLIPVTLLLMFIFVLPD